MAAIMDKVTMICTDDEGQSHDFECANGFVSRVVSAVFANNYEDAGAVCRILNKHFVTLDPREPDASRQGIFRGHNCYRCEHGKKPCVNGGSSNCEYPRARND